MESDSIILTKKYEELLKENKDIKNKYDTLLKEYKILNTAYKTFKEYGISKILG